MTTFTHQLLSRKT